MRHFITPFAACLAMAAPAAAQNAIPTNAKATCAVTPAEFATWIADENGGTPVIAPPDSFAGDFNSECAFYKWGARMFLWLTSSAEGEDFIFDSTGFFDVVHDNPGTEKIAETEVLPNGQGRPNVFALRGAKPDFRGASGQAGGGGVLISQAGSLTYYGMHVNDAYVAFRNGASASPADFDFTDAVNDQTNQFPSTRDDMQTVVDYGVSAGVIASDAKDIALKAGTLELKTSWVDASTVDRDAFVVVTAQVPKFTQTTDTEWTADGVQSLDLAMVGMHVAGPVVGHPELVWASFEHLSNTPIGAYLYTNTGDQTQTVPYDGTGAWTFAASGTPFPAQIDPKASVDSDSGNIVAASGQTIAKQDIVQVNPWGLAASDETAVSSNTDLISLNASLIGLLDGDANARDKYYQLGSVWTDGTLPEYQEYDVQRGGLNLANATMESFHQFGAQAVEGADAFIPRNCFDCHSVSGKAGETGNEGVAVSHIFQGMQPYSP